MSTHNSGHNSGHEPEKIDASKGFEQSDVRISGILKFLLGLGIFAMLTAGIAYELGKFLDAHIKKEDGPPSRWAQPVDVRPLGDMPSSAAMQKQMAESTLSFPLPRVQTDDGNQDVADLHTREDLLLENYSWFGQSQDQSQGKVRIPIERAMELLAQRGLPVALLVEQEPLMTGDKQPAITIPLTSGFARTGYELDQAAAIAHGRANESK